jgi:hypothetical protein
MQLQLRDTGLPLRTVTHRYDELHADEQNAGILENVENVCADVVAERVDCGIS